VSPIDSALAPVGWASAALGELLSEPLANGFSIKGSSAPPGVPALKLSAMSEHGFDWTKVRYLPVDWADVGDLEIRTGDFFISRGNGSLALVGRGTSAQSVEFRAIFPDTMIRARLREPILSTGWIQAIWSSRGVREQIEARVKTTAGIWKISQGELESIKLPIPPLDEQRRIVIELEKQVTRLDAGIEALERVQTHLKRYRASVLKAACEGRLVPIEAELARRERRTYEPAGQLLERLLGERRTRWEEDQLGRLKAAGRTPKDDAWKHKYVEPIRVNDRELPALAEGWTWATMDQLCYQIRNGISARPEGTDGLPILRISAVRPLSVNIADIRWMPGATSDWDDYLLAEGDLLFTRYNGSVDLVGVCGAVPSLARPMVYPDKLIRCRVRSPLSSRFLDAVINSGHSRAFLASRTRTTAGQSGVSGGDLRAMPVPLAPLAEQARIATEVARRLSFADAAALTAQRCEQRARQLRQAILACAFSGQLVTQDPREEPAASLLERLRPAASATEHTQWSESRRRMGRPGTQP